MTFSVPGYRVEHLLGYGSQSQVWAARALDTGERVAIKRIAVDSPAAARATRAEAALLAALNHPSLIGLRGYLALGAEVALVMELAEAGSLADLLRRRGRLSPAEVVATISPIAAALAHAHDEGVLHADVSAANVLFTAAGQPKLADLGIARLLAGPAAGLGTPAYLDPVLAAGGAAGPASDVFALAAVALHALTGAGPWLRPGEPSGTAEQVLATAATGQILDLAGRLTEASPELAEVLARALNIEPHRRGTAAELALDLRAAVRPVPVVLAGGRIQSSVGRHSVELRERDRAAQRGSSDGGAEGAQGFPPADLTHVARPRVRASVEPEPVARRRWPSRTDRRLVRGGRWLSPAAAGAGVLLAISGLAVAGGVARLAQHRDGRAVEPAASSLPSHRAVQASHDPLAILAELDGWRAAAYAQRQPGLLSRVYHSPTLLAQDTALLLRTVPAGCQLLGLHTGYQRLAVLAPAPASPGPARPAPASPGPAPASPIPAPLRSAASDPVARDRLQLQVTAMVSGGRLQCAGQPERQLAPASPTRLSVLLSDTGSGFLIAAESASSS